MGYYLFAILPNINMTLGILLITTSFLIALWFVGFFITLDYDDDLHKTLTKIGKWFVPIYFILIMSHTFIPSQKQLAFIIAAPYVIENQDLKDISKNSTEIIKLGTEYVKDILKEKVNEN